MFVKVFSSVLLWEKRKKSRSICFSRTRTISVYFPEQILEYILNCADICIQRTTILVVSTRMSEEVGARIT